MKKHQLLELLTHLAVLLLKLCPIFCVVICFLATCFQLDYYFFLFQAFLPSRTFLNHSSTIAGVRFILFTICHYEFFWTVSFAYSVVTGIVDVTLTVLWVLTRKNVVFEFTLRIYAMIHLVLRSAQGLCDFAITSFLAGLMGATIMASYLSISAYSLVPLAMYLIYPSIVISAICSLHLLLVPFTSMCEESTATIVKLKILPATVPESGFCKLIKRRKLMVREIAATRPFALYAGMFDYRFHKLEKPTKIAIIEKICGFTISALLAKRN